MAVLIDTSVLCRLANTNDLWFTVADSAVAKLRQQGESLHITAQNLIEFHSAATRDTKLNGIGLSVAEASAKAAIFEAELSLLPETPDIFPAWKAIVSATGVVGKQVHDARLVAVCHVHQIAHVLTFNVAHFTRFSLCAPGLTVLDPVGV